MLQSLLVGLVFIAIIVWRFRRLMAVLQGGGSMMYKVVVGGVIGLFLVLRVVRLIGFTSGSAAAQED